MYVCGFDFLFFFAPYAVVVVMRERIRNRFYRNDSFKRVERIDSQARMDLKFGKGQALCYVYIICSLFLFLLTNQSMGSICQHCVVFRYDNSQDTIIS